VHILGDPSVDDGSIGLIVLEDAVPADFAFLGLEGCWLPDHRHASQDDEDAFCRRLLRLGARPWNHMGQFEHVMRYLDDPHLTSEQIVKAVPDAEERRWVSVAWPSGGGVWVTEVSRASLGTIDSHCSNEDVLHERGRLKTLALSMDAKAAILEEYFDAEFYQDPSEYKGDAFLASST
jgi:hypothetical protein